MLFSSWLVLKLFSTTTYKYTLEGKWDFLASESKILTSTKQRKMIL